MTAHRGLRRYLWGLLTLGTAASVAANVGHAHPVLGARVLAVAAPLSLLAFTHLVGLWSRVRTSGATYWAILVTVALIAAGAARVSFAAVRDLATGYGYGPVDSALIPLMLDGGLAVVALALVVLGRIEAEAADHHEPAPAPVVDRDEPAVVREAVPAPEPLTPAEPQGREIAWSEARFVEDRPVPEVVHAAEPVTPPEPVLDPAPPVDEPAREPAEAPANRPEPGPVPEPEAEDHGLVRETPEERAERLQGMYDRLTDEAEAIIATGRTTQPVAVVRSVLHGLDREISRRANAEAAEVSPNAVRQIEAIRAELNGRLALVPGGDE